jgi:hypothetical protein
MAITGDGGEVLLQGKPAEPKAVPTTQSKGSNMQQNDGNNEGQQNNQDSNNERFQTTYPSAAVAAEALGVGGGIPGAQPGAPRPARAFARPVMARVGGMADPTPQMGGAAGYIRSQMGFGGDGYMPPPFNIIDMEEHISEVALVEEVFATYLCEFPPARVTDEERDELIVRSIRHALAMVRNLREFAIAQLTEHLGSRQNGHDPFFAQHRIPRLVPVPEHEAEGKPWESIPFPEYLQRLGMCFPNFNAPVFMHMLAAFGPMLNVATSTVDGAPREHFLILPDAKKLVDYVIEMIKHQTQGIRRY